MDVSHVLDPHPVSADGGQVFHPGIAEPVPVIVEDLGVGVVVPVPGVAGNGQVQPAVLIEVAGHGVVGRVGDEDGPVAGGEPLWASPIEIGGHRLAGQLRQIVG